MYGSALELIRRCEGEKTREERDAELRGEAVSRWTSVAVSLDNFGGMRGVARCAARVGARW